MKINYILIVLSTFVSIWVGAQYYSTSNNLQKNQQQESKIVDSKDFRVKKILAGIAYVESRSYKNPYLAKSIPSKNGDRAYGKYQIMGKNIPSWTKMALGQTKTIDQFLNGPDIQEKTAYHMIMRNVNAGYGDNDIASIWFSGRPMKKAGNAKDAYGTSVPQYVKVFNIGISKYLASLK